MLTWKESISLISEPLVEIKIDFPSGLNFNPVHSQSFGLLSDLNEANGPLSKDLKKKKMSQCGTLKPA